MLPLLLSSYYFLRVARSNRKRTLVFAHQSLPLESPWYLTCVLQAAGQFFTNQAKRFCAMTTQVGIVHTPCAHHPQPRGVRSRGAAIGVSLREGWRSSIIYVLHTCRTVLWHGLGSEQAVIIVILLRKGCQHMQGFVRYEKHCTLLNRP